MIRQQRHESQGIAHHPSEDLLLAYASGAADEAAGLIVATHLAFCPVCRTACARLDAVGGSLLQELAPAPLAAGALNAVLARLDASPPFPRRESTISPDGTPEVLRPYIGGDLSQVQWRRVSPHLSYRPLFRRGTTAVRLLRGVAGAETGPHRHRGEEYTLVLKGGFSDVTGRYGPGDLQMMEGDLRHNPVADPGEDCINLAVTRGQLEFDRWLPRIVAPLFGF